MGHRFELGGDRERSEDASESIAEQLPIAALLIVFLRVAPFSSVRRAAIVLLDRIR